MSEDIEIELTEETSKIIYENYEKVKDDFDSFDEYMELLSKYINVKMKEEILKSESKRLRDELKALESSSNTWAWWSSGQCLFLMNFIAGVYKKCKHAIVMAHLYITNNITNVI